MRRAARVDKNHSEIVRALLAMGCSVKSLAQLGAGAPDLLVGYKSVNLILECKDGAKVPSKRKLSEGQQRWHEAWRGQVNTVTSWQEACELVRLYAVEMVARHVA